jgi:hypothetical protein
MAGVFRWAGFALGLVIVVATFTSVVGTIVLPKDVRSRICSGCSVRCRPSYGAYNRRETLVNMLERRAGSPPGGWSCWPASSSSAASTRSGHSSTTGSGGPPTSPRAT